MTINLNILIPERVICKDKTVDEVILPAIDGLIGVLENHVSIASCLKTGVLRFKINDKWSPVIIYEGVTQIQNNKVTVLVTGAEECSSLDLDKVTKELEEAKLAVEIAENSKAKLDAKTELEKAKARVEAAQFLA